MDRRYFSCAALASYDDSEPPANPGRAFSQEEVNRLLADDRRKHQARIDRVQRTLEEVSASKNLSVKEREQLATQLEAMAAENRTREEQLVHERTQLEKQHAQVLADEKKNTDAWRKRFEDSAIQNALVDASHRSDAFSTDQIVRLLRPSTRIVERADERGKGTGDYEVVVDLPDTDEQGNPTTRTLSARRIGDDAGEADLRQPLQIERRWRDRFKLGGRRHAGRQDRRSQSDARAVHGTATDESCRRWPSAEQKESPVSEFRHP